MSSSEPHIVLVVDDDSDIRAIVSNIVSLLGFTPVEAADGLQALALYQEFQPDVIVLDVMLPGKDGNQVCKEIKQTEQGRSIPIIMLTAKDGLKDKVSALEGGADDYLTKPFHYQELQARLQAQMRVRELSLHLQQKNTELQMLQDRLIQMERQLVVTQLAGSTAHSLGQPLSAALLNCHLIEVLKPDNPKYKRAIKAIKNDLERMAELIEKLRNTDANKKEGYYQDTEIITIDDK